MSRNKNNNEEPKTAPHSDRWYNITLGPSFTNPHASPKFCTLRYEFKPASIDKSQPGSLHKGKDNKVKVEYHNNQYGKPKVTFDGASEDYKENDAVLFFDGETFRLERLHRAVKRLRHVRLPGEPVATAAPAPATFVAAAGAETYTSPARNFINQQPVEKGIAHQMQVQFDQGGIGDSKTSDAEPKEERNQEHLSSPPSPSATLLDAKEAEPEGHIDIVNDDGDDKSKTENISGKGSRVCLDIDINLPHQADTDDEIADVDINDDEPNKGPNAAEALRAQVNAEGWKENHPSSSSSSSGSDSSGSGTETGSGSRSESWSGSSSSSDSESSEGGSISI